MKSLTLFLLVLIAAGGAQAQERAYTLDGTAIELRGDGSYQIVTDDNPPWKLVFSLTGGQTSGSKCSLEATLQNNTEFTVQYLKQCFKVFTQRGGEAVCFNFGGGRKSDRIPAKESVTASANFRKGACNTITGAEPYFLFNGRDPSEVNVDGLPPFDARRLFYFSKAGLIAIGNSR